MCVCVCMRVWVCLCDTYTHTDMHVCLYVCLYVWESTIQFQEACQYRASAVSLLRMRVLVDAWMGVCVHIGFRRLSSSSPLN